MTQKLKQSDIDWTKRQIEMLIIGGIWGVPRSGLMIQRTGQNEVQLTAALPHQEGMDITPEQLKAFQQDDWNLIRQHIEAAGFTVKAQEDA